MEVREQDQVKQEDKSGSTKSPPCTSLVLSFSTFNTSSALSARVRHDNRMVPCGGSSSFYYALDAARSRSCACDPIRSGASQVRRRRRSSCTGHIGRCRGECEVGQLSIFPLPPRLQDLHCMHEICRLWSEDQRLGVEIGPGCVRAHYCRVSSKNRYLALRTNP